MNLDSVIGTFIAESRELLQQMEDALLQVEQAPGDLELINAIFRAAHTIKGSAGLFGFDAIVAFTHVAESVLDRVRGGELALDASLVALLLAAGDHLAGLIEQLAAGADLNQLDEAVRQRDSALLAQLSEYLQPAAPAQARATEPDSAPAAERGEASAGNAHWQLSLRFGPDLLRYGMDPLGILRYLATLGELVHVEPVLESIPALPQLDPEHCYLGLEVALASDAGFDCIDGAFEFVREDSSIHVLPPNAPLTAFAALLAARADEGPAQLERLQRCTGLDAAALAAPPVGSVAASAPAPQAVAEAPAAAPRKSTEGGRAAQENNLIRVDAGKLDQLIDLVGELIIAGANVRMLARHIGRADMSESAETLSRLVEEVRDSTLTLRMVQIGATFNRFQRVVRDVSRELGKDIVLQVSGGETELDKTVVEKIGDPLTHLVRNAMDHGIENAERRLEQGKPLQGVVSLDAYHEAGGIVIEVADDGGGLDPQRILAKAVQRGLVGEGQVLSEKEIFNLIFEPGFSTAEQVSNLSGRGVGMDVVKRNIAALRGSVELESRLGEGTRVRIRLPLTLAIIDGFLIGVGQASYVVPLDMVEECIELPTSQLAGQRHLDLRGELLPLVRLRELFEDASEPPRRENVVVVGYAGMKLGLVVDQLLGEFQTVIKPLGKVFCQIPALSGFTILGSGTVALILDIPGLLSRLNDNTAALSAAPLPALARS